MIRLSIFLLIIWISLSSCKSSSNYRETTSDDQAFQTIPKSLLEFVKLNFPDHTIPDLKDYVQNFKSYSSNEQPYYCSSDFNGDGKIDYALLLNSKKELFLYAFLSQDGTYNKILVDKFDPINNGVEVIITVEPKGTWEAAEDSIAVLNDGIAVELIEESLNWSYYFNDSKFIRYLYD